MTDLEAGRDLDALVAEKVMGLVPGKDFGKWPAHVWQLDDDGEIDTFAYDGDNHNGPVCTLCDYLYCHHCGPPTERCYKPPPAYSKYIITAWQVVEKMQPLYDVTVTRSFGNDKPWECYFHFAGEGEFYGSGETAPLAICRAALEAVGANPSAAPPAS